jgi:glycosyltransferase involved in cell wall biosynthesis
MESFVVGIGERAGEREGEFRAAAADLVSCPYRPGRRLAFVVALRRVLRDLRAEAVLCWSFGNHAMVSLAGRLAGARRCYVSVQGSPARDPRSRRKNSLLALLARPFCTGEIACSGSVRDQVVRDLGLPARRVTVIPNAVDAAAIAEESSRARAARKPGGPLRVLMAARMDDAKDHPTLLRAVKALRERGVPVRAVLAGDGPRRAGHEALARDLGIAGDVEFLGSRGDVAALLGGADAAALATHTEGLPLALLEAMAAGVPAVATDIPPCREALDEGRCGLLVPPGDAAALVAAIQSLSGDRAAAEGRVSRARQRVAEVYDADVVAARYAALLGGRS